jgi:hypothetical protein
MKFEFLADASDTPPKRPSNPSVGYPSNGDPVTGKPPTTPGAWFYYMLMVEFTTLIEQNGLEPSAENLHQLADVFADFKARASAAEGFATQAKASADAAAESASGVVTETASKIKEIQDEGSKQVSAVTAAGGSVSGDVEAGIASLQKKLEELVAQLDAEGGTEAAYVKQQAQDILDAISLSESHAKASETNAKASADSAAQSLSASQAIQEDVTTKQSAVNATKASIDSTAAQVASDADDAASSQSAAATSAKNAATSESNAKASASAASNSASAAKASQTAAATSESNAKASADAAAVSASSAATTVSDGKQAITDLQAAAVAAIQTQKNEAVAAVTATQSTATESVTAAQASSVSAVKAQEAASIQAIEADSVLAGYAKATDVAATYLPLTGGTMSLGADAGLKFNGQAQICSYMDGAVCIRNLKDPTMPKIYMGNLGSGGGTLSYTNPGDYFAFSAAVKAPSFQATSDARKKTGLTPVHPDLSGLTAYRYTLKDDGKTHVGLVAQEVEKVIPEAVAEDKEGFLALDYNAVVAALVDEVSRLRKRVEALEAAK